MAHRPRLVRAAPAARRRAPLPCPPSRPSIRRPIRALPVAVAIAVLLLAGGCSTRRVLEIDSNPAGARIWVNGTLLRERTPVRVPFVHYGRFDVRLEKEGHRSVAAELHVPTELDGYPVVDLPLELLTPEKRFRRVVDLPPLPPAPDEADVRAVLDRARALRERTYEAVGEPGTPGRSAVREFLR